ncbi:DUF6371 domain-containing protein [Bacteroides hominis]|uniref:DUF6371 domain-containing protein n=1 Tax=Bacteroides TaxID=816 RepID=UPI0023C2804D|nr:DUF6371 domain-containing protein [Bacteroides acidifaciens]MDE6821385.1 hypothetical protein [Bacteroides acidifaciens]
MSEYRFHLQRYRTGCKVICPKCGMKSCFTRYVDEKAQVSFPDKVGRCDHINSCGYHYTPKEYFQDNPAVKEMLVEQERNGNSISTAVAPTAKPLPNSVPKVSHLPSDWVEQSMRRFDINPLYRYLTTVAGKEKTDRLFNLYKVGTSKMWNGATVFWQIDINGNVRAGKIMGYDAKTGHRIKHPFNQVNWVHSVKRVPDFHMKQCLFGEHLLVDALTLARTVAIVESEKTALIASLFIPDFVWLATGGMHGSFNSEAMQVLQGHEVILFPDLRATEEWQRKVPMLQSICRRVTCSDLLEKIATDRQREAGLDIADFLLMEDTPQMVLARMVERNPALRLLIDELDLALVE